MHTHYQDKKDLIRKYEESDIRVFVEVDLFLYEDVWSLMGKFMGTHAVENCTEREISATNILLR